MNVILFSNFLNLNDFGYLVFMPLVLVALALLRKFQTKIDRIFETMNWLMAIVGTVGFLTWLWLVIASPVALNTQPDAAWWDFGRSALLHALPLVMWIRACRRHMFWSVLMVGLVFLSIPAETVMFTAPFIDQYLFGWKHTTVDTLNNISLYLFLYFLCFALVYVLLNRIQQVRQRDRIRNLYL